MQEVAWETRARQLSCWRGNVDCAAFRTGGFLKRFESVNAPRRMLATTLMRTVEMGTILERAWLTALHDTGPALGLRCCEHHTGKLCYTDNAPFLFGRLFLVSHPSCAGNCSGSALSVKTALGPRTPHASLEPPSSCNSTCRFALSGKPLPF